VGETAEELYARARGRLRLPPVEDWVTFPFDGELRVRELLPPVEAEPPRAGEGGSDCWRCELGDADAIWSDERWVLAPLREPSGMPVVVILCSRAHHDLGDLPAELQAELGPLLVRIERAVASVPGVGRVHVCRWGDGGAHFHVWFIARPERLPQLKGSFVAIWDDILPPLPEELWRENLALVAQGMTASAGRPSR
jgi:diadenosine tetraphosphate (Ap4A) HIT family hydrolase